MMRTMFFGGIAAVCASIVLAGTISQPDVSTAPQQVVLMEAWQEYMTPGAEHALLARKVGSWNVRIRTWSGPDAASKESYGSSEITAVMGGRFLLERVEGEAMGRPFSGLGLFGYDNLVERFVGVAADSMGTGITRFEGTLDEDGTSITMTGQRPDVLARKYRPTRLTERRIDEDTFVITVRETPAGGIEHTTMELTYSRR